MRQGPLSMLLCLSLLTPLAQAEEPAASTPLSLSAGSQITELQQRLKESERQRDALSQQLRNADSERESAQLATLRDGAPSRAEASAAHFAHREDSQAQTATERDLEFALDDHESTELRRVNAALQRLANGSYGLCADCGVAIAPARLQAAPARAHRWTRRA